jgi:DNA-binding transcriptional regulator GbsR (MarR family)
MNLRALMDWGLVHKELKPGQRKEFFIAEKDIWEVIKKIIINRKRKELEPALKILDEVTAIEGESVEVQEFKKTIQAVRLFSSKADALLETLLKADSEWFVKSFLKMVK